MRTVAEKKRFVSIAQNANRRPIPQTEKAATLHQIGTMGGQWARTSKAATHQVPNGPISATNGTRHLSHVLVSFRTLDRSASNSGLSRASTMPDRKSTRLNSSHLGIS